jgi:hypothetical protein
MTLQLSMLDAGTEPGDCTFDVLGRSGVQGSHPSHARYPCRTRPALFLRLPNILKAVCLRVAYCIMQSARCMCLMSIDLVRQLSWRLAPKVRCDRSGVECSHGVHSPRF